MERRGQAAMEFLMTYGWAILAAVIAIAVLAYFGVFSPGKYIAQSQFMSAPWGIEQESFANATGVTLYLTNGGADVFQVKTVAVSNCGSATPNTVVNTSATSKFIVPCTLTANSKFKGDITVTYNKTALGDLTATGNLVRTVGA